MSNHKYNGKRHYTVQTIDTCKANSARPTISQIEVDTFRVIQKGGEEIGHKKAVISYSKLFSKKSIRIWLSYAAEREKDYTLRSGFHRYGCYDGEYKHPFFSRKESVTEHTMGTISILNLINEFYPESLSDKLLNRCQKFMRYHDLGEVENGDIPDNGNRKAQVTDNQELVCLAGKIYFLPEKTREKILHDFEIFNQPYKKLHGNDRKFHCFCKLADKTDAILRGLVYEKKGHTGYYSQVPENNRSADETIYAGIMGDSLVSVFTGSFIKKYHRYEYFPIFFDIIRSAIITVHGKWFDEWETIIHQLGVSKKYFEL